MWDYTINISSNSYQNNLLLARVLAVALNYLINEKFSGALAYFIYAKNKNIITNNIIKELNLKMCVWQFMLTWLLMPEESMSWYSSSK